MTQNVSDLLQAALSQRNLAGLILQVNQIDVCTGPDLTVYATITDADGNTFEDLRAEDIQLSVDDQVIDNVQVSRVRTEDLPLATTLVIDHSGSMDGDPMVATREAAAGYVQRMAEGDAASVVQFDTQVETLVETTTDRAALTTAIDGITPRSDTALYDAIAAGVAAGPECGRRAVVTMTDGRDTASTQFGLDQTIGQANATNTPVFVVGLETSQFTPEVLNRIATDTGA